MADIFFTNNSGDYLLNQTAVNMTFNMALVFLNNSAKNQIVSNYGSLQTFQDTVKYVTLRFKGSLKHAHSLYPEFTVLIKLELKPCKINKLLPGKFDKKMPFLYTLEGGKSVSGLPASAPISVVKFSEFTFEPSECELDTAALKIIYTPFSDETIVTSTSAKDALQRSLLNDDGAQSSFKNYPSMPKFIKFAKTDGLNTFKIQSTDISDIGTYKIFIKAEVYDPYTKTVFS